MRDNQSETERLRAEIEGMKAEIESLSKAPKRLWIKPTAVVVVLVMFWLLSTQLKKQEGKLKEMEQQRASEKWSQQMREAREESARALDRHEREQEAQWRDLNRFPR